MTYLFSATALSGFDLVCVCFVQNIQGRGSNFKIITSKYTNHVGDDDTSCHVREESDAGAYLHESEFVLF